MGSRRQSQNCLLFWLWGSASRDAAPQPDDYGFSIGEDGLVDTFKGNGTGGLDDAGPGGPDGRVRSTGSGWSAELRLDASVIGGWNKLVGLDVEQVYVTANSAQYWPRTALWHNPASWAAAVLGDVPQLSALAPATAITGGGTLTLTVSGTGFLPNTVLRWDGQDRATTVLSATQLRVTISAADLTTARTVPVTAAYPGGAVRGPAAHMIAGYIWNSYKQMLPHAGHPLGAFGQGPSSVGG